jgi:hypothetical protein
MLRFLIDHKSEAKLLATLADMDEKARNKLTRSSLRQAVGPLQRKIRRDWKSHPTLGTGDGTVRKAIARATLIQVGRLHHKGIMPRGKWGASRGQVTALFSKVYISYKKKYGPARLAHLLENPNGKYPTTYTSWEIHTKAYKEWHGSAREVFQMAARAFLAGYQMKVIRKAIKGKYG